MAQHLTLSEPEETLWAYTRGTPAPRETSLIRWYQEIINAVLFITKSIFIFYYSITTELCYFSFLLFCIILLLYYIFFLLLHITEWQKKINAYFDFTSELLKFCNIFSLYKLILNFIILFSSFAFIPVIYSIYLNFLAVNFIIQ